MFLPTDSIVDQHQAQLYIRRLSLTSWLVGTERFAMGEILGCYNFCLVLHERAGKCLQTREGWLLVEAERTQASFCAGNARKVTARPGGKPLIMTSREIVLP